MKVRLSASVALGTIDVLIALPPRSQLNWERTDADYCLVAGRAAQPDSRAVAARHLLTPDAGARNGKSPLLQRAFSWKNCAQRRVARINPACSELTRHAQAFAGSVDCSCSRWMRPTPASGGIITGSTPHFLVVPPEARGSFDARMQDPRAPRMEDPRALRLEDPRAQKDAASRAPRRAAARPDGAARLAAPAVRAQLGRQAVHVARWRRLVRASTRSAPATRRSRIT